MYTIMLATMCFLHNEFMMRSMFVLTTIRVLIIVCILLCTMISNAPKGNGIWGKGVLEPNQGS